MIAQSWWHITRQEDSPESRLKNDCHDSQVIEREALLMVRQVFKSDHLLSISFIRDIRLKKESIGVKTMRP